MMKKWLLVLLLLIGCMGSAHAECVHSLDAETGLCTGCGQTIVAQVGDEYYVLFEYAVKDWADGTTLTLHDDVNYSFGISIPAGNSRIFDGGEYTLHTGYSCIDNAGELTIYGGAVDTERWSACCVKNTGTLNVYDLTTSDANSGVHNLGTFNLYGGMIHQVKNETTMTMYGGETGTIENSGTLTMKNGLVSDPEDYAIRNSGTLTVNGGIIRTASSDACIYNDSTGTVTVNGALLSAGGSQPCLYNQGTATVSGGMLEGAWGISSAGTLTVNAGAKITTTKKGIENSGTLRMNGGEISSADDVLINSGTATISGGRLTDTNEGVWNHGTMTIGGSTQITGASFGVWNAAANAKLTINGGVISGGDYAVRTQGSLTISGGGFDGGIYDLTYDGGTITITAGIPKAGWTLYNITSSTISAGTQIKLPSTGYLCDQFTNQTITQLASNRGGTILTRASNPPAEPVPVEPPAAHPEYKDGVHSASALGFGGQVSVKLVTLDGWIVDVQATGKNESVVGEKALQELPRKIIAANGTDGVDAVTSATFTSRAILQAAEKCLSQTSAGATLKLPQKISSIHENAFANVAAELIIIPDGFENIGGSAFKDMSSLRWIRIPESVEEIADTAFDGCGEFGVWTTKNSAAHLYAVVNGIECRVLPQ